MRRRTWANAAAVVCVAFGATAAEPTSSVRAELSCRPEAAPGRVLCELRYQAAPGVRLVWADALVMRAPDFARPLRSRVTPERFKEVAPGERKLSLAFVATTSGAGQIAVKARTVSCAGEGEQESCHPETQELTAELRVGS